MVHWFPSVLLWALQMFRDGSAQVFSFCCSLQSLQEQLTVLLNYFLLVIGLGTTELDLPTPPPAHPSNLLYVFNK